MALCRFYAFFYMVNLSILDGTIRYRIIRIHIIGKL